MTADDESRWLALCVSFVGALILTMMLVTSGCSPLAGATHAANATLAALDTAAPAVEACGDEWREAASPAALAEVDRVCLPLVRAYRVARLAHAELVAAVELARATGGGPEAVAGALRRALESSTALASALGGR